MADFSFLILGGWKPQFITISSPRFLGRQKRCDLLTVDVQRLHIHQVVEVRRPHYNTRKPQAK